MKHKASYILAAAACVGLLTTACGNNTSSSKKSSSITSSSSKVVKSKKVIPSANAKNRPWTYKNNVYDAGIETYTFTDYKVLKESSDNSKVLVLFCDVTNNSDKEQDPSNVYMVVHAYQKTDTSDYKLEPGILPLDKDGNTMYQEQSDNLNNKLLPGKTAKACMVFKLKNNNPVKVTFEDPNFDEIGSKTYKIN